MLPTQQQQQLLTAVQTLNDEELAVLEDTLRNYVADDERRLHLLKEKLEQVRQLRDAIQKEDTVKINSVRAKLGLPPTTS